MRLSKTPQLKPGVTIQSVQFIHLFERAQQAPGRAHVHWQAVNLQLASSAVGSAADALAATDLDTKQCKQRSCGPCCPEATGPSQAGQVHDGYCCSEEIRTHSQAS